MDEAEGIGVRYDCVLDTEFNLMTKPDDIVNINPVFIELTTASKALKRHGAWYEIIEDATGTMPATLYNDPTIAGVQVKLIQITHIKANSSLGKKLNFMYSMSNIPDASITAIQKALNV
jgi:hypothetical protein